MKKALGFTLVEIIVTVSVVAILSAMLITGMQESGQQSRDTKRQADIRLMQSALELYKNKHGRYPEGCNSNTNAYSGVNIWSGQPGNDYECSNGAPDYIRGNTGRLFSDFLPRLPVDPRSEGNEGYVYRTNANGTVYKLIAVRSVETSFVTGYDTNNANTSFRLCDTAVGSEPVYRCAIVNSNSFSQPTHCVADNATFRTSYAAWGGIDSTPDTHENIICSAP